MDSAYGNDLRPQYAAGLIICMVSISLFLIARVYAQYTIKQLSKAHNYLAVIAGMITLTMGSLCLAGFKDGLGIHIDRVIVEDPHPPARIISYLKISYAVTVLSSSGHLSIKLSILALYHHIFTAQNRYFKLYLIVVATYLVLLGVGSIIEFTVQCLPIHYYWDRAYLFIKIPAPYPVDGWCMANKLHFAFPLIADAIGDVVLLILPAIGLWNLQLAKIKKIGVFIALSLGLFAGAVQIVLVYYCFQTLGSVDATYGPSHVLMYAVVELSVGVICACIPASAPLLKLFQRKRPSRGDQRLRIISRSNHNNGLRDNDSEKGLKEVIEDPYSCTIAYDSSPTSLALRADDIPMQSIQVSQKVDISHELAEN